MKESQQQKIPDSATSIVHEQIPEQTQTEEEKSTFLFWCCSFSIILFSIHTIVYIYAGDTVAIIIISVIISILTSVIFLTNTCILCSTIKEILKFYFLMDNALLILVLALVSWNVLPLITFEQVTPGDIIVLILNSLSMFSFVGNFRVLVVHHEWKMSQVILTKIFIIVGVTTYITIGCYFMITQAENLFIVSEVYAAKVKDFIIFYVLSLFALFLELYGKISNIDGTNEHKFRYSSQIVLREDDAEKKTIAK